MSHLSLTERIDAPATVVFDLIADPSRSPEWQSLLVEMGSIAGRPGGVGSSFAGFYRIAGRRLSSRFVVTAAERPTLFQVNGTTTGGWARWTTVIAAYGSSCEIQVNLEYELPGEIIGPLFGMLTASRIEREFKRTYKNLKQVAETGSAGAHAFQADDEAAEPGAQLATT
ncbi:MAG: SRPBCC family protein [Chloroflexi bacterium]|nr:SRPBCC family protein [Chloroflexota bacterium]